MPPHGAPRRARTLPVLEAGRPPSPAASADPLAAEGWARRFVAAEPRLREAVALYESLGYQVRLRAPAPEELREECGGCAAAVALFRVIYTRRAG
jgi:hypothetical protein